MGALEWKVHTPQLAIRAKGIYTRNGSHSGKHI